MAGFIFVSYQMKDKEALQNYASQVPETLKKFEGKMLIKGKKKALSGNKESTMQAVLSFPSSQQAKDWYHSEEYGQLIPLREEAMTAEFHLVC